MADYNPYRLGSLIPYITQPTRVLKRCSSYLSLLNKILRFSQGQPWPLLAVAGVSVSCSEATPTVATKLLDKLICSWLYTLLYYNLG